MSPSIGRIDMDDRVRIEFVADALFHLVRDQVRLGTSIPAATST